MRPKEAAKPLKRFSCYADEDKVFRDELEKQLNLLKHQSQITSWSDRDSSPG